MRSIHASWLVLFAIGCGGGSSTLDGYPDSTGTVDEMKSWVPSASAAAQYYQGLLPIILAGVATQNNGTCPAITMSGTTTTYAGGCTDSNGNMWVGSATATAITAGGNSGPGHIEYDGFGETSAVQGCTGKTSTTIWNGTVDESADSTGAHISFSLDISLDADGYGASTNCTHVTDSIAVAYSGSIAVTGPSNAQVQTFDGSGEIGTRSHGKVSASTASEVVDSNTCNYEALSGTTTITASGHTAVVTYDGATSCDQAATVTWTYDGADQGELSGVSCSAGGAGGAASGLLVLGALAIVRRRRS